MTSEKLKFKPLQNICDDERLRNELWYRVRKAKSKRFETQKEVSRWIGCSLTKIKEIENGSIKDFNTLNNYLNYLGE